LKFAIAIQANLRVDYQIISAQPFLLMGYVTKQKLVLRAVLESAKRPLTAGEICQQARHEIPSLGMATVYRAIKQLVSGGHVCVVGIPGLAPHYESAARHHHHFFLCQQCNRLFDLIGCVRGVRELAPSGFRVQQHEIVLYGQCASCVVPARTGHMKPSNHNAIKNRRNCRQ
jgi:Fur family ferric uptake transcriptional regulator